MRIVHIDIKNYRSCIHTNFSPNEHLSVLIGPNGSGKTNVLSAMRLLQALARANHRFVGRSSSPESASPCRFRVTYEVDGKEVVQVATIGIVTNEKNLDEITGHDEYWLIPSMSGQKRLRVPNMLLAEYLLVDGNRRYIAPPRTASHVREYLESIGVNLVAYRAIQRIHEYLSNITYYGASQFTNPGNSPISFEVESEEHRRIGISITGHKKFLFDLYQERREKLPAYDEFIALVGPDGMGLIDEIEFSEINTSASSYSVMTGGKVVTKEKRNLLVVPKFKVSGNELSPSQLSEGTFKTLALVFYIIRDKSSVLMIEEPEVCVHHGLLSSIVELVKSHAQLKQIFISTHSDSVLDRVDVDNIFSVTRSVMGTTVLNIKKKMGHKGLAALRSYLATEGSLGEYWKHGDLENV